MEIRTDALTVWPQGAASAFDDLTESGRFGYLNEQVLWIRHSAVQDSRSALRVPEGIDWKGKERVEGSAAGKHHYQDGQQWQVSKSGLYYEDCPISNPHGPSPGHVSAVVGFAEDEIIRMTMTIHNSGDRPLEKASSHFCLNHRRAPLLGRSVTARSGSEWVDFAPYISKGSYRHYFFEGRENPGDLPTITDRLLFTDAVVEAGTFVLAIGSSSAGNLMSNYGWPCTDIRLGFGNIGPGESASRDLFIGMGVGTLDGWLERIGKYVEA